MCRQPDCGSAWQLLSKEEDAGRCWTTALRPGSFQEVVKIRQGTALKLEHLEAAGRISLGLTVCGASSFSGGSYIRVRDPGSRYRLVWNQVL